MKRKFEELRENLDEFVQQDDYPMLIVGCLPAELAYVVKLLQGVEEEHPQSYFTIFPQPCDDPAGYLDGIAESIRLQVEAAGPLRAERGEPPFPPLPPSLFDRRIAPAQRLIEALQYLSSLLPDAPKEPSAPNEDEHRVVVGLLPLTGADREGYARLLTAILPVPAPKPWMKALRIIGYDDRAERRLVTAMRAGKVEHVLTFEIDFSTPALADAIAREAADPSAPVPERMTALLQLAALDHAHRRYDDAVEKYRVLFDYHEATKNPTMQAMALLGAGDALRASGQAKLAKQRLQQGIALAVQHQALPVLLNLFGSITGLCLDQAQHADAEGYADSGAQVAAAVLNPYARADLFEMKGDAQMAQGKVAEALASYQQCRELCKKYELFQRWKSVLERLQKIYADAWRGKERREIEDELQLARELERRGGTKAGEARA